MLCTLVRPWWWTCGYQSWRMTKKSGVGFQLPPTKSPSKNGFGYIRQTNIALKFRSLSFSFSTFYLFKSYSNSCKLTIEPPSSEIVGKECAPVTNMFTFCFFLIAHRDAKCGVTTWFKKYISLNINQSKL